RQRCMVGLGDEPIAIGTHRLSLKDYCPGRNGFAVLYRLLIHVDRIKNHLLREASSVGSHPLGSHRGERARCRGRMLRAAPDPEPLGGFRIPSSNSFKTTALLRSSSLEAKTKVTLFRS